MAKYQILINKIIPAEPGIDRGFGISARYPSYEREQNVFEATLTEEEVIEMMNLGYKLKEKLEHSASLLGSSVEKK